MGELPFPEEVRRCTMPDWVAGILAIALFAGFVYVMKHKDELFK